MNDNVTGKFFAIMLITVVIAIYFIPTFVARGREHKNATSITVLNLLLGWSIVGWVIALVWAYSAQPEARLSDTKAAEDESVRPVDTDTEKAPKLKSCPYCAEEVRFEAIKCRHCASDLSQTPA